MWLVSLRSHICIMQMHMFVRLGCVCVCVCANAACVGAQGSVSLHADGLRGCARAWTCVRARVAGRAGGRAGGRAAGRAGARERVRAYACRARVRVSLRPRRRVAG